MDQLLSIVATEQLYKLLRTRGQWPDQGNSTNISSLKFSENVQNIQCRHRI